MTLVSFLIFWLVGLGVASFTLIPILIIIFFAFPLTKSLQRSGKLTPNNNINRDYTISLILLGLVFIAVLFVIYNYFFNGLTAFLIGNAIALFFGVTQTGNNTKNMSEYMEKNKQYIV